MPTPIRPEIISDGRARRADTARQPHDKWTFVVIPPGTGAHPRTLHVSVRRLRAIAIAIGTTSAASVVLTAFLGLLLATAPRFENEFRGVQLGVLASAPAASTAASALPTIVAPPMSPASSAEIAIIAPAPFIPAVRIDSAAPGAVAGAMANVASSPVTAGPRQIVRPAPILAAPRRIVLAPPAPKVAESAGERSTGVIASLPVIGRITSNFSRSRRHPLLGVVRRHHGVDIAAPSGTRITAPAAGRVTFAGRKVGFGLVVEIDHGSGVMTRYAHCRSLGVRVGRRVKPGETIATVGRTGLATGPHLHYEVLVRGRSVDPLRTSLATLLAPDQMPEAPVSEPTGLEVVSPTLQVQPTEPAVPPADTLGVVP
jgi:murein DD-endopeptidase MepM/ murein hydrolase activator NlpD